MNSRLDFRLGQTDIDAAKPEISSITIDKLDQKSYPSCQRSRFLRSGRRVLKFTYEIICIKITEKEVFSKTILG